MKKMLFVFSVLALTLVMVGGLYAQSPQFNTAWLLLDKTSVISTTTNDTIQYIPLTTGEFGPGPRTGTYDIHWFFRSADSVQGHLYYQLRNAEANCTGTWTLIDSVIHVDAAGSAGDTSSQGVAHQVITETIIHGFNQVRFYLDYNAGTVGTSTSALGDATANRFRFYVYLKPMSRE